MNSEEKFPGAISNYIWKNGILFCSTLNKVLLSVEPYTPEIIRIRYGIGNELQDDFSYALDPDLKKNPGKISIIEEGEFILLITDAQKVRIHKSNAYVDFMDLKDQVLCRDEKGFHWEKHNQNGNNIVKMTKQVYPSEVYFGLGDKPSELNLKGRKFENWGTDSYGYRVGTDPLYKNIPFYYGLHNNISYGIFFDNTYRTYFDFAKERNNATSFWAHGGEMNYYFIAGPSLLDVSARYAKLTGKHDMPAMWSLGFQQCKWSYYPESEVREVTDTMRKHRIPCDAIYLDIDYMDGFRCFTWDKEKFPNPKKMIADLSHLGFKTMVIIDPGIKIDTEYQVFNEAIIKDYFCKCTDGTYVQGKVWPGDCYFPDFTKPEVREWWADQYKELIQELGVAGVWNDMNEPALFEVASRTMPDDSMFNYDGHIGTHEKAHNVYGMQMARATYEGVKKYGNNKRGLIISRSGYSGLQRYSSVWTGDNIASWKHIWLANIQCQRLSVSGVSFAGSDIGGFIGQPTPEMFVRWIQLAIFHPFCRVHSSQDDGNQEPWSFGEQALDLFREAIELRYRMLPYHYSAFYNHVRTGRPILRPLSFYDQEDVNTYYRDHEFMCGDHILTSSINQEGVKSKETYIPRGNWYNYWTGEIISGGKFIRFPLSKNTFPLFVKEGAIIPHYPVQQYVGEKSFDEIELKVFYKNGIEFSHLYEDAHDGYDYLNGEYKYSTFQLEGDYHELRITQTIEGNYLVPYKNYKLTFSGLPDYNCFIEVDDEMFDDFIIPVNFRTAKITWKEN